MPGAPPAGGGATKDADLSAARVAGRRDQRNVALEGHLEAQAVAHGPAPQPRGLGPPAARAPVEHVGRAATAVGPVGADQEPLAVDGERRTEPVPLDPVRGRQPPRLPPGVPTAAVDVHDARRAVQIGLAEEDFLAGHRDRPAERLGRRRDRGEGTEEEGEMDPRPVHDPRFGVLVGVTGEAKALAGTSIDGRSFTPRSRPAP
jgi:hypothetical protein